MTADTPSQPAALVVEDDEHIGHLLKFMLDRAGYAVTLCPDGRAAQAHIQSQPAPAVALFDVMLPFMDGFQLVGLVRKQPGWEKVPVIMLTAKAQERDIVRALDAGANDYIVKPFQPEELLARLRRFVRPQA
ncbi:response regulator transcription factor [Ramlibacter sp. XY19]|uniref:response regulator transcription factor n=1 Tax=Ramlibacter paludis TaxID=2908000 RepID=UPI0023DBE094|nr:response regulator transcription factor [Ramlibacter paludis]MCG2593256.1 response regulator transcription factor [Ramlibacter paludis]